MLNKLKKLQFWKNDIIEFYCHPELYGSIVEPRPAVKSFPEWFKSLPPYSTEHKDQFNMPTMTAKKCFPLIDAMSLGFTMPLAGDLYVKTNKNCSKIDVQSPAGLNLAEFHGLHQVGNENAPGFPAAPVKFINHWIVKTAPGWSTLFITPINHINRDFTCLGGLVDTDTYPKEVNFPAIWHACNFDGLIDAGTPLVTAIPIKRNSFDKKPKIREMSPEEFTRIKKLSFSQNTRRHVYTQELRAKK